MSRPRLTPHQRAVLGTVQRYASRTVDGWVRGSDVGSAGALAHLVRKGYLVRRTDIGPRGGQMHFYRLADS